MCDWEEFLFVCRHSTLRLKSYCHFARNDPNHQCLGVKKLRDSWYQDNQLCDDCLANGFVLQNGVIWRLSQQNSSSSSSSTASYMVFERPLRRQAPVDTHNASRPANSLSQINSMCGLNESTGRSTHHSLSAS
ncbi:hypothetical protein F4778DRAFT_782257 [Xylariomycetidae sp. FL2044]|nr:hypothetical protein F4778DRAFT_782257 [Xylariomycetidae sp. FL2044]